VHPFGDLSAYLDGALSSEARASTEAHLDSCALCRTRLAELRATASLIAALPTPLPSRSLVPRVAVPRWLAPLRTVSTLASAAAIFLFIATAAFSAFPRTQSAGTAAAPAAAPNAVGAPQPTGAFGGPTTAPGSQDVQLSAPTAAPGAATNERSAAAGSTAPADTAKEVGRQDSAGASDAGGLTRLSRGAEPQPSSFLLSPWLWLGLAIVLGALSLILGRLRST
jgi:anti-sigma factor RsiW